MSIKDILGALNPFGKGNDAQADLTFASERDPSVGSGLEASILGTPSDDPLKLVATSPVAPRRPNRAWLISGLSLIVVGGGLAFMAAGSLAERVPIVIFTTPIAEGQVIERASLGIREVLPSSVEGVVTVEEFGIDPDAYIGKRSTLSLPAGSPLLQGTSASDFEDVRVVVLGAELSPGEYPEPGLSAGDRVAIILLLDTGVGVDVGFGAETLTVATVSNVTPISRGEDNIFASIEIDEQFSEVATAAFAQGRARLVLVTDSEANG